MINNLLASVLTISKIEAVVRAETVAHLVELEAHYIIDKVLTSSSEGQRATLLASLPRRMGKVMSLAFQGLAYWSHREFASAIAKTVPRQWLRAPRPDLLLVGEDIRKDPLVVIDKVGPFTGVRMTDEEWEDFVRDNVVPPPTKEKVAEIIRRESNGVTWEQRLDNLSHLIEPEKTASVLTRSIAEGLNVQQLTKKVLPHVTGNVVSSAKRIARTEALRVANEVQRESYEDLGELMVGTQILASLDENTRPEHAMRNGTIFYRDGRTPSEELLPVLPDEPNCRCFDVPVLQPPKDVSLLTEFADTSANPIPDPVVYSQWFDSVEEGRRKLAVGVRRYNEMKRKLGDLREPQWSDFIQEDGSLIPLAKLKEESLADSSARKTIVGTLIEARKKKIEQIRATSSELPEVVQKIKRKTAKAKKIEAEPPDPSKSKEREKILQALKAVPVFDRVKKVVSFSDPDSEFAMEKTQERIQKAKEKLKSKKFKELEEKRVRFVEASEPLEEAQREIEVIKEKLKLLALDPSKTEEKDRLMEELGKVSFRKTREWMRVKRKFLEMMAPSVPVDFIKQDSTLKDNLEGMAAFEWLGKMISIKHSGNLEIGDNKGGISVKVRVARKGRAFWRRGVGMHMARHSPARTWVHEMGHALEEGGLVHELIKGYLFHRLGDEKTTLMRLVCPFYNKGDARREKGRKDKWVELFKNLKGFGERQDTWNNYAYYTGKSYLGATEVLSIGMELLYSDPLEFAKRDPEFFKFTLGILNGDLLDD